MKKVLVFSALVCLFVCVGSAFSSWTYTTKCQIGKIGYQTTAGKVTLIQFALYDYVGGNYLGTFIIGVNNSNTGDVTAYSDLKEIRTLLERAYTNWESIYRIYQTSSTSYLRMNTGDMIFVEAGK